MVDDIASCHLDPRENDWSQHFPNEKRGKSMHVLMTEPLGACALTINYACHDTMPPRKSWRAVTAHLKGE